jgi:hypothetical protein
MYIWHCDQSPDRLSRFRGALAHGGSTFLYAADSRGSKFARWRLSRSAHFRVRNGRIVSCLSRSAHLRVRNGRIVSSPLPLIDTLRAQELLDRAIAAGDSGLFFDDPGQSLRQRPEPG